MTSCGTNTYRSLYMPVNIFLNVYCMYIYYIDITFTSYIYVQDTMDSALAGLVRDPAVQCIHCIDIKLPAETTFTCAYIVSGGSCAAKNYGSWFGGKRQTWQLFLRLYTNMLYTSKIRSHRTNTPYKFHTRQQRPIHYPKLSIFGSPPSLHFLWGDSSIPSLCESPSNW